MFGRRMTLALTIVAVALALYVGILGLLWQFQERIVFQPPANPGGVAVRGGSRTNAVARPTEPGTSTLEYQSSDGISLLAYVVGRRDTAGPIVLAFHGNAMISRWMIPWAREVSERLGATVVLPEYRGYDGLAGVPTYAGAALDAKAALAATTAAFHVSPRDLAYYGHSLGSAVATELASVQLPRALLLESPFTSARDMAGRWPIAGLGFFWPVISRVHYSTVDRVAKLDVPVHVAHGDRDLIVPFRMGRAVHAAAARKGQFLAVPGAGHNDVASAAGDAYWEWMRAAVHPAGQ